MFNLKRAKTFLIAMPLVLLLSQPVHAASYTVAAGDSLFQIGKLFNTTSSIITANNKLSSSVIYPGQVLNVQSDVYTVKSGDSLYVIAKRYGLSIYSLRKANNQWNDNIYPDQKLVLPGIVSNNVQTSPISVSRGDYSRSVIPYTNSDLNLLARLITAEADGEPYKAKVSVGAVVVNRVKDSRFSNSISGVIYEKYNGYYQFTPVENGWINKPATQDAKNAAYDALHGVDPTNGAIFYFDDSTTNQWMWSKPIALRVDKMVYTY